MRPRIPGGMGRIVAVFLVVAGAALLVSSEKPAFTSADKAFYADPKLVDFVRPGLVTTITAAEIASDGTIKARVRITDPRGLGLDRLGTNTPGAVSISLMAAYIPRNASQYVSYTTRTQVSPATSPRPNVSAIQASADSGGTWTDLGNGLYEYVFRTRATGFDPSLTHSIGVWSNRNLSEFELGTQYSDAVFTWVPAGGTPQKTRDVVKTATCNDCHQPLMAHGGSRQKVELCVMCHTPQTVDPDTGETQDFPVLVHKIHMGANLPSVQAGTPYVIIGNANSRHDYSTVHFPVSSLERPGVVKCESCHDPNSGARQANAFLTQPSRAACGSCHDNVNFATGEHHANLPQVTDNQCSNCHNVQGELEFDLSIKGAHTMPEFSATRAGINLEILNVTGRAGERPVVTFSVRDNEGRPIPIADLQTTPNRLAFVLSGPTSDYGTTDFGVTTAGYVSEQVRAATCANDGTCTYTFTRAIPADAKGTFAIGAEGRRELTLLAGTTKEMHSEYGAINKTRFFSVDGSAVQARRQAVDIAKCNACHGMLKVHGENRNQIDQCVLCHNPRETDKSRRPAAAKPDATVDMAYMIHRIHAGEHAEPNREYTVYGFGGTPYDFTEVRYPGNLANCNGCHVNNSQQVDGKEELPITTVTTPRGLLQETPRITNACIACHTSKAAASHALANTTQLGESCSACHGQNAEFSVNKAHAQ